MSSSARGKESGLSSIFSKLSQYARSVEDQTLLLEFFDALIQQVKRWQDNPKSIKSAEKVAELIKNIININFPLNEPKLFSVRAKQDYLCGLIHEKGLPGISVNLQQARRSYEASVINAKEAQKQQKDFEQFENIEAAEKLGDVFLEQARKSGAKHISTTSEFLSALSFYAMGDEVAKIKLVNDVLMPKCNEDIKLGRLSDAINDLQVILKLGESSPLIASGFDMTKVKRKEKNLIEIKKDVDDTNKISAAYLRISSGNKSISDQYKDFINLKKELNYPENNPVFDYYNAMLLKRAARIADEFERVEILKIVTNNPVGNNEPVGILTNYADFLLDKIVNQEYFECEPVLNFAIGLAKSDNIPLFKSKPKGDKQEFFQEAAKYGCYLAYSYLGDFEVEKGQVENATHYYGIGAHAGDPRAQFVYVQRYYEPEIRAANIKGDKKRVMLLGRQAQNMMKKMLQNPDIVDKENVEKKAKKVKEFTDICVLEVENISFSTFSPEEIETLLTLGESETAKNFKKKLAEYSAIPVDNYERRLDLIREIYSLANNLMNRLSENTLKEKLKNLAASAKIAEENIREVIYFESLEMAAAKKPWQRVRDFKDSLKKGHMGHSYYMEKIDPLHRGRGHLFGNWLGSLTNQNYFSWLLSFDSFSEKQSRVKYFSTQEAQRLKVEKLGDTLFYSENREVVPAGEYLYALDEENNLFIADHKKEHDDWVDFHHSSFLSGEPVACAGELVVKDGLITHINNYSGHYAPNIDRLIEAVQRLEKRGLLAQGFKIGIVGVELPRDFPYDKRNLSLAELKLTAEKYVIKNIEQQVAPRTASGAAAAVLPVALDEIEAKMREFIERERPKDLHPCLPAAENINDKTVILSDHVYTQLTFDIGDGKKLSAVSCNMLGGFEDGAYRNPHGPRDFQGYNKTPETEETLHTRHKANAEFLDKVISNTHPAFIALQEIDTALSKAIDAKKGTMHWDGSRTEDRVLFDDSNYEAPKLIIGARGVPSELGGVLYEYKDKNSDKSIFFGNLHADFGRSIPTKENLIRSILQKRLDAKLAEAINDVIVASQSGDTIPSQKLSGKSVGILQNCIQKKDSRYELIGSFDEVIKLISQCDQEDQNIFRAKYSKKKYELSNEVYIFCGDWNANIGPLDNRPRNICTAIGHPRYRPDKIQGALYPDGGFSAYFDIDSGKFIIKQAESAHLNPNTGLPFEEKELPPLDIRQMNDAQAYEVSRQKMVMCLDESFQEDKLINNQTIFEYEAFLRKKFPSEKPTDGEIIVRATKNTNNESGIGIQLRLADAALLDNWRKSQTGLQFNYVKDVESHRDVVQLCATTRGAKKLHNAMVYLQLHKLDQAIKQARSMKDAEPKPGFISSMWSRSEAVFDSKCKADFIRLIDENSEAQIQGASDSNLLHHAAYYNCPHIMRELLKVNRTVDVAYPFTDNKTPMHFAISQGNGEIVKILMEHKANPHLKIDNAMTSFELAIELVINEFTMGYDLQEISHKINIVEILLSNKDNKIDAEVLKRINEKLNQIKPSPAQEELLGKLHSLLKPLLGVKSHVQTMQRI